MKPVSLTVSGAVRGVKIYLRVLDLGMELMCLVLRSGRDTPSSLDRKLRVPQNVSGHSDTG